MSWRRGTAIGLLLASLVGAWAARSLEIDNRLERWRSRKGESERLYQEFRRQFGSDEFVLAAISGGEFFTPETLDLMLDVAEELEAIPGVSQVRGIPTVYRDLFGGEDPEALADEMTSTPFYRNLLIGESGETAALLVRIDPGSGASARRQIVQAVRRALQPLVSAGRPVRLVGYPVLMAALDEVSLTEARRTMPVALLGSLLMLGFILRSARSTMIAALCAVLSLALTLGLARLAGISLNMATSALPPLLSVLALSNSIHILRRYQDLRSELPLDEALRAALAETTRPCTLAAVTTAAGFGSLAVAPMAPIRELGLLAAGGILLSLAVNLTVLPLLVEWLRVPAHRWRARSSEGSRWDWGWREHPRVIVGLTVFLLVAAVLAIPAIEIESAPLGFLPPDHAAARDFRALSGEVGGFYTLELVLRAPGPWFGPDAWPVLDEVSGRIARSPGVSRVLTPVDLLRKLNQWENGFDPAAYRPPPTLTAARELLSALDAEGAHLLRELALDDQRTVRLSVLANEMEERAFLALVQRVETVLGDLPPGWQASITGQILQMVRAQRTLVSTQLRSLALAMLLIGACIAVGLRSWRLTTTAVLPNLLPTVAVFAFMAALALPLDAATVMVASVALGIAVDNTVHVLENVRRRRAQGMPVSEAASETLRSVGPALATTTATACAGFLALLASDFLPLGAFGLLAAAAMVVAFVADVLLLPAILVLRRW